MAIPVSVLLVYTTISRIVMYYTDYCIVTDTIFWYFISYIYILFIIIRQSDLYTNHL